MVNLQFAEAARVYFVHGYPTMTIVSQAPGLPNEGAVLVAPDNYVVDFVEGKKVIASPVSPIAYRGSSTGCYFLKRELVERLIPEHGPYSLERGLIPDLVALSLLAASSIGKRFVWDYGTPERIAYLNRRIEVITNIYGT